MSGQDDSVFRWGVLGAARVAGRRMVPAFRGAAGSTLLAIASRTQERADAFAEKHGVERAYASYEALLDDDDIDAVFIPLPNDQHCEWTLRALAAGKHVLCDKPAALSFADARSMADAASKAKRRFMEGFMYRHHPQHAHIRSLVANGAVGNAVEIRGACTYFRDGADRSDIRWSKQMGGGALLDVGVYPLNAARLYFGDEPFAVTASGAVDSVSGVDLHTTALMEFSGGRTAVVTGAFNQPFASTLEILGPGGVITASRAFQVGERGVNVALRMTDDTQTAEDLPHLDQYALEVEHFAACARDPVLSLWPGENGLAQARAVEAVRRSFAEHRRVNLDEIALV